RLTGAADGDDARSRDLEIDVAARAHAGERHGELVGARQLGVALGRELLDLRDEGDVLDQHRRAVPGRRGTSRIAEQLEGEARPGDRRLQRLLLHRVPDRPVCGASKARKREESGEQRSLEQSHPASSRVRQRGEGRPYGGRSAAVKKKSQYRSCRGSFGVSRGGCAPGGRVRFSTTEEPYGP